MAVFSVGEMAVPFTIRKSRRAKNISITVSMDGVTVTAPGYVSEHEISSFIEKKRKWISQKVSNYEEQKKRKPRETEFVDGENLKFQGDDFLLQVLEYDGKTTKAALKGDRFVVHLNRGLLLDTRREEVQAKLEQLYRDKAREAVLERLEYFKSKLGVDYNGLRIKDQKTRWGSCSKNGNLNFNWKIVIAPSDIIDYIVVHELCHLLHMNHSKEFWETVASQIPGYKDKKRWLKENGPGLKL